MRQANSSGLTVVVAGASGIIGAKLVARLTTAGHRVVPASRRTGVDVTTGAGLHAALSGADVVVDVTDSPSYAADALDNFFTTATANLIAVGKGTAVRHHVALSVVGADRMPDSPYESAKVAQERLLAQSGARYTVLRATQFFEFATTIADALTEGTTVHVPDALIQPIAGDDVAAELADIAVSEPRNGVVEVGGPEYMPISEFLRIELRHHSDPRVVVADAQARYFGANLQQRTLVTDQRLDDAIRFTDWLQRHR